MNTNPKKVSSTDIARLAGVSQATVSRVLSGSASVKKETRDKVNQVIREAGYRPNAFAQAMRTNQSGTVGVAVSRITNPIIPEILEALAVEFAKHDRRVVVWNTDIEGEQGLIQAMGSGLLDGVIFTAASHQVDAVETALDAKLPVVSINRMLEGAACNQIVSTNRAGGAEVAQYLLDTGRKTIAFVNGPPNRSTLSDREAGFRDALAERGQPLQDKNYYQRNFKKEVFRQVGLEIGKRVDMPDAVACGNDLIAIQVMNGLRAAGRRVPEDIWVVGFDGIELTGWDIVDLTTMRQPIDQMATDAAALLVKCIEGGQEAPSVHEYRVELVIRGSTAHRRP